MSVGASAGSGEGTHLLESSFPSGNLDEERGDVGEGRDVVEHHEVLLLASLQNELDCRSTHQYLPQEVRQVERTRCLGILDILRLDHSSQSTLDLSSGLNDDSRAIQHPHSLLQHDLLHLFRPSGRRGDSTGLGPLERVDEGRLSDIGVSDQANRERLLDLLFPGSGGSSGGTESLDELHEGLGGGSRCRVGSVDGRGGEVVALLLRRRLEGDSGGLQTEVGEPRLDDGGRHEICTLQVSEEVEKWDRGTHQSC